MEYRIKIIKDRVYLCRGRKKELLHNWLAAHIGNQTHTARAAKVDRYSVNLICKGTRDLGHTKFFKILAAINATISLPD